MSENNLTIRALGAEDAPLLSAMLLAQPPRYARFFYPFSFDIATIAEILRDCEKDVYEGMIWDDKLVGFFMLRGWDAGFEVPAYGLIISRDYRGYGLEMLSLEAAKVICNLRGATRIMLKMHPDNFSAKGIARKIGFVLTGVEAESGNAIYHFDLTPRSKKNL